MDSLYRNAADSPVESTFTFDSHILAEALKNLYKRKYDPKNGIDPLLFSEVARIMGNAVDVGFENPDTESEFIRQLKSSTEVFAAFKVHRMGRDMAAQLLDDKGQLKSFRQFKQDVAPISSHHIDNWLKTEYNTAVRRAHLAADFERYKRDADILPNLRWEPSTSVNKRELHIPFYDRVWAIDDPFWADNFPGSLWNCKCGISPTDDPLTDNSDIITLDVKPHKGLDGNPAVTGQIFSDDHPYHPADCRHCPFGKVKPIQIINAKKDCYACGKVHAVIQDAKLMGEYERLKLSEEYKDVIFDKDSGGLSAVHIEHNFDPTIGKFGIPRGDYEKLSTEALRKAGHKVILASEHGETGVKTPDGFLDDIKMDIKGVEGTGKWTIKNKFLSAGKQEVETVILYFHDKDMYSLERVKEGWFYYLYDLKGHSQTIRNILCVVDGEVLKIEV